MKIAITGSSGFVGTRLTQYLMGKGHRVTGIDAVPARGNDGGDEFQFIQADTTLPGDWQAALKDVDAVVNLTGRTIFHFWTKTYKEQIYNTRILTTRHIVEALPENGEVTLVSTSAAGFYGDRGEEILDESKASGEDFLAGVCVDWEKEANAATGKGVRVATARFGVILGKDGGALATMLPVYRMFVGGPLGSGQQWFPWVHIEDLIAAIAFVMARPDISGPLNFCSPYPVRNTEFANTLAKELGRPAFLRTPAFVMKWVAGEMGKSLLNSQRAVGDRLIAHGFQFQYPYLADAIRASI